MDHAAALVEHPAQAASPKSRQMLGFMNFRQRGWFRKDLLFAGGPKQPDHVRRIPSFLPINPAEKSILSPLPPNRSLTNNLLGCFFWRSRGDLMLSFIRSGAEIDDAEFRHCLLLLCAKRLHPLTQKVRLGFVAQLKSAGTVAQP
ncbi:hypothetical protein [Devosia riboflavina]